MEGQILSVICLNDIVISVDVTVIALWINV